MKHRSLGWRRDLPDIRDDVFASPRLSYRNPLLPSKVYLGDGFPPPYDQGNIGSCTAQAVGAICDYKYGIDVSFIPSTLFLYYCTRALDQTIEVDAGATIRDTIKAVNIFGISEDSLWPYIEDKFSISPTDEAYQCGLMHQALKYRKVRQKLDDLRAAIAEGHPIAFGFSVYESFYKLDKKDPVIKKPSRHESMQGGHAVVAVGYDDAKQHFIIRNSWGVDWADKGHFRMPYTFILDKNLCSDFWTIELMEKTIT